MIWLIVPVKIIIQPDPIGRLVPFRVSGGVNVSGCHVLLCDPMPNAVVSIKSVRVNDGIDAIPLLT